MREGLSPEEQKIAGFIIGGVIALAIAIIVARQLFPVFLVLSILSFVGLIVCGVKDVFFRDEWSDGYWSLYALIIFGVCFGGLLITYFIGYGIGGTPFGEASLEIYYALTGAQQEISDALRTSINQVVEENCKILPEESCNILKQTAESAQTLQEVTDMADKLKKSVDVVNSLSK